MHARVGAMRALVERHRGPSLLVAGTLTAAGVDLLLFPPKGQIVEWFALPFLGAGLLLLALMLGSRSAVEERKDATIAGRLIRRLTVDGRLVRWLPVAGIGLILVDLGYNAYLSASPQLLTEDLFALLFAGALIAYPYVPTTYRRERDFVLVALSVLVLGLVLPLLVARAVVRNWEYSVDVYSWVALAYQLAAALSLIGVPAAVHAVPGSTAPGLTVATNAGTQVTIVITTACSGLYSFGLFVSAFFAYVLTEFRKLNWRVWAFLSLGVVSSYLANLLRMVVVVLSGVYADTPEESVQNLLTAHSYAGWLIFLAWIGLFWLPLTRYLRPVAERTDHPTAREVAAKGNGSKARMPVQRGVACSLCHRVLTPARPGYRCECGTFYHADCARSGGECLNCQRPIRIPHSSTTAEGR